LCRRFNHLVRNPSRSESTYGEVVGVGVGDTGVSGEGDTVVSGVGDTGVSVVVGVQAPSNMKKPEIAITGIKERTMISTPKLNGK
jgi:hypothetical protein